jgi:hypothetical protein
MKLVNRNWIVAEKIQDTNEHKICKKVIFFSRNLLEFANVIKFYYCH